MAVAVENGNFDAYYDSAHAIKGSVGSLGARRIQELAGEACEAAVDGNRQHAMALLTAIDAALLSTETAFIAEVCQTSNSTDSNENGSLTES